MTNSEVAAVTLGPMVTRRVYGRTRLGDMVLLVGLELIVDADDGNESEEDVDSDEWNYAYPASET